MLTVTAPLIAPALFAYVNRPVKVVPAASSSTAVKSKFDNCSLFTPSDPSKLVPKIRVSKCVGKPGVTPPTPSGSIIPEKLELKLSEPWETRTPGGLAVGTHMAIAMVAAPDSGQA